ncbi:hypothetical protein G5I_06748 [Acromyrmex echinatior]|uniref:Uncharacterized protein n=1 Tax=Acromyrmex echinatior TaxID=103372 RepID=F4WLW6_ACREC|nr:hypothetical protein G5I_06748 [Acromyrmex echinatior]
MARWSTVLSGVFLALSMVLSLGKLLMLATGTGSNGELTEADQWLTEIGLAQYRSLFRKKDNLYCNRIHLREETLMSKMILALTLTRNILKTNPEQIFDGKKSPKGLESPRHRFLINELELNDHTVIDWTNFCREVIAFKIETFETYTLLYKYGLSNGRDNMVQFLQKHLYLALKFSSVEHSICRTKETNTLRKLNIKEQVKREDLSPSSVYCRVAIEEEIDSRKTSPWRPVRSREQGNANRIMEVKISDGTISRPIRARDDPTAQGLAACVSPTENSKVASVNGTSSFLWHEPGMLEEGAGSPILNVRDQTLVGTTVSHYDAELEHDLSNTPSKISIALKIEFTSFSQGNKETDISLNHLIHFVSYDARKLPSLTLLKVSNRRLKPFQCCSGSCPGYHLSRLKPLEFPLMDFFFSQDEIEKKMYLNCCQNSVLMLHIRLQYFVIAIRQYLMNVDLHSMSYTNRNVYPSNLKILYKLYKNLWHLTDICSYSSVKNQSIEISITDLKNCMEYIEECQKQNSTRFMLKH